MTGALRLLAESLCIVTWRSVAFRSMPQADRTRWRVDGETGLLVEAGNRNGLEKALCTWSGDNERLWI